MPIDLQTNQIPGLITWFNSFVGFDALQNRLRRVETKLSSAAAFSPALLRRYQFHVTYQAILKRKRLNLRSNIYDFAVNDALSFIAAVNHVARELPTSAQNRLRARIIDGLSPDRDIRQLQHETRAYIHYRQANCKVIWLDDEENRFDFLVEGPNGPFEVECKTFAENIGNPISLDDSFFLFEEIRRGLDRNGFPKSGTFEIELTTRERVNQIVLAAITDDLFLTQPKEKKYDILTVRCEQRSDLDEYRRLKMRDTIMAEFASWQQSKNRHCMLAISKTSVVFVSLHCDRTPKPYYAICDSLKKASKQFSKQRPAVVWGHFLGINESEMRELLERKQGGRTVLDVFGNYLFKSENRNHVCRLRLSADGTSMQGASLNSVKGGGPAYDLTSAVSRFDAQTVEEARAE
jgi:hypothetical protein